jgi:hypothetical protein
MKSVMKSIITFLKKPGFLAFLYFSVLTLVMTYPLVVRMGTSIVGSMGGDNIYFVWLMRWFERSLFELHISPFFSPFLNYPQGWYLTSTDTTPIMIFLGLPGTMLVNWVWGYNFSMMFSFVLAGWFMYFWVRRLTGDNMAGLVAGTIYGFLPYHMAHFVIGHLNLSGIQWFPLFFWGLFDLLRQKEFSWKPVLLAAVAAGLIGLTSMYYIYMTVIMAAIFTGVYFVFGGFKRLKESSFWKSTITFGILAAILVGLTLVPYLQMSAQNGLADRSAEYVSNYSASVTDFFVPSRFNFLWGEYIRTHFSQDYWQESNLYIGALAFLLMVIGWFSKKKISPVGNLLWVAGLTALAGYILALGIDLHWLGQQVTTLPAWVENILHHSGSEPIYLPAYYLFLHLPFFAKMRVMMRFGLFTLVMTSMMAGIGAHTLMKNVKLKIKNWAYAGLLVLAFLEFFPGGLGSWMNEVQGRPVDYWLAEQPETGAVAQFPFSSEGDQTQVFYTGIYEKPFLGGFFNANSPEQYNEIAPVMASFPSVDSISLLQELGVAYVVVDSSQYEDFELVDHEAQENGLVLIHISENEYVYSWP